MRVVVVVPALAKRQQRHPPAVAGIVPRPEAPAAPHVRRGVHEPGAMKSEDDAEEDAPEHHRPATDGQQHEPDRHKRHIVIAVQPPIERHGGQIRRVLGHQRRVVMVGVAEQNPAHVGPEAAVARRMRIAIVVGMLMVNAMGGDPEDRTTLERQRPTHREKILERS